MRLENHIGKSEILTVPLFTNKKYKHVTKVINGPFDGCKAYSAHIIKTIFYHYAVCSEILFYLIKEKLSWKKKS